MGVIDDIYSMLDKQRQEQANIFKRFDVKKTKDNHLILPERFREEIGEMYHRIHFSKYIENDKGYVVEKDMLEFGTLKAPYVTGEDNNE